MSAIAVILRLNKAPVGFHEMQCMLDRLEHRGSDEMGILIDKNIGLANRMRRMTPESELEALPSKSGESSCSITCDTRLDNREELIEQLYHAALETSELPDSSIILRAYDRWGEDCAEKLLGDFVFAIWDPRKQKLFCARDSMGVKHFYYYYKPGVLFAIASEIKALFCLPDIPKELDEANIGDILILNHQDKEITPYRGVKRIPANTALRVDDRGLAIRQYWRPKPRRSRAFRSSRDYEAEFAHLFTESVNARLRTVRTPGSLLSGGLDSSSISCVASSWLQRNDKPPLETFSAVFPSIAKIDTRIDERRFINTVVKKIRCNANYIEADAATPFLDLDKLQWHADHPVAAPNVFMDWALFKAAKERNVGVLLSGFDGDSTVSYGYEAFSSLARQGRWLSLFRNAMALTRNMPADHHNLKQLVWRQGFLEATPDLLRQVWRVAHGRPRHLPSAAELPSSMSYRHKVLKPDFARELHLKDRYLDAVASTHPEDVSPAEAHWNALSSGLFAFTLESFEKLAAAFDIEMRFPFFDRRLIEFCISLPAKEKVRRGWTRSIHRRAMQNVLPAEVQWRTDKANIGLSYKINMLRFGTDQVDATLFGPVRALDSFIERETLKRAWEKYSSDPIRHGKEAMLIISTVYLSNWLQRFSGNRAALAH